MREGPLRPARTSQFKRDYKRCKKRGWPLDQLRTVMEHLIHRHPLDERCRDHGLAGEWRGSGETITFERTGTHSDLFE